MCMVSVDRSARTSSRNSGRESVRLWDLIGVGDILCLFVLLEYGDRVRGWQGSLKIGGICNVIALPNRLAPSHQDLIMN